MLRLLTATWSPLLLASPSVFPRRPRQPKELKRKTILKDMKMDPNYGTSINPVSRLIQIQQVKGAPEPNFVCVQESGQARAKEFTVQVEVEEEVCVGKGQNKKLAKRAAAEAMLEKMGYAKEMPKPGRSALKTSRSVSVDEEEPQASGSLPEEEVVCNGETSPDHSTPEEASPPPVTDNGELKETKEDEGSKSDSDVSNTAAARRKVRFRLEANRRAEFLTESAGIRPPPPGSFPQPLIGAKRISRRGSVGQTAEMGRMAREMLLVLESQSRISRHSSNPSTAAIQQLGHLAALLGFHIHFTDFPRTMSEEGRAEHLSLVSLGVAPPRVCHGSGASLEEARNEAAIGALKALADIHGPAPPAPLSQVGEDVCHLVPKTLTRRSARVAAANLRLSDQPLPKPPSPVLNHHAHSPPPRLPETVE